jgi:acyl-CoA thioesterase
MIDNYTDAPNVPFLKTLGVSVKEIADTYAEMAVTIDERHLNYMGGAHGGLISALVDTVSFFPRPLIPSGLNLTTVSLNINYVSTAGIGDTLIARSDLLHLGRSTASLSVKIVNQNNKLVAHGTSSLMVLS